MKSMITFLLSVTFLPQVICAQPVVTNNEYYDVGDVINMVNVNPTSITVGAPGAGVTWDFTTLSVSGGNSVTTVANNTSGIFGTSNLMITLPNGDVEYMSEGSGNSYVNGLSSSSDTLTYDTYNIAKRPFTYLGYYLDTYKVDATNPVLAGGGSLAITGDAYGTLKLPSGTYTNVLRIRKLQEETDTISGGPSYFTTVKYMWFDTVHHAPLFEMDSTVSSLTGNTNTAMYLDVALGVQNLNAASNSFTGYLGNNNLQITGGFEYGRIYDVILYSIIGSKLFTGAFTATGNVQRIDMDRQVIPGIYIVSLTQRSDPSFREAIKVVKQ